MPKEKQIFELNFRGKRKEMANIVQLIKNKCGVN